jgi:hypothetical protein
VREHDVRDGVVGDILAKAAVSVWSSNGFVVLCCVWREAIVVEGKGKGGVQVGVHAVWESHGGLFSGWPMYAPRVCEINWCVYLRRSGERDEGQERCVFRKRVVTLPSTHRTISRRLPIRQGPI